MNIMASTLPATGVIAGLYYSERLEQLPLGVIGNAIATALLPALTRHIAAKEESSTVHYFSRALEIAWTLCLPACLILMLMPHPIIQVLFQHGIFTTEDTRVTSEIIQGYALSIPGAVLVRIFTVRFFAHENTRMPVIASLCTIVINTTLCYYMKGVWFHAGIAYAYAITMWANALIHWFMLQRFGYAKLDKSTWRKVPRLAISGLVMATVILLTTRPIENGVSYILPPGFIENVVTLAIRVGLAGVVYLVMIYLTGAMQLKELRALLKNA